jgi:7-cyano-7-deazaguanine synthase in queuosine biosynthesis
MSAARYTNKVLLIVQKDEMSIPDRTADFLKSTSEMLSYMYDRPITVRTPFADMDKVDMVQWWMDNKLGTKRLVDAWTCYSPVPISGVPERQHVAYRECGDCPACIRKYIALSYCGVEIKGHFAQDPKSSETGIRYKQRAQDGEFSVERTERTLKVLK